MKNNRNDNNVFFYVESFLSQRIPKKIAASINIPRNGDAMLVMGEANNFRPAQYFTSTDGRIRFKYGWAQFALENDLHPGLDVLVLFNYIGEQLFISFDVVG